MNLAEEVETEVMVLSEKRVQTSINGVKVDATVSRRVAEKLLELDGGSRGLAIRHKIPVPIGSGFGTSGAGAIGVAMAGSEALGLGLTEPRGLSAGSLRRGRAQDWTRNGPRESSAAASR